MVKFVCISDTHLQHGFDVPDGDVLLHAGDYSWRGNHPETWDFLRWFESLPHKHKVFIAGNHDWGFQKEPADFRSMVPEGVTYLQDSHVTIEGFKIYGSPWQPEFCDWAFNLSRYEGELAEKWAAIPDDTDILITHGPPWSILDATLAYGMRPPQNVGCRDLYDRTRILSKKKLRLHVFGHIHSGAGQKRIGSTVFVNASVCNEQYKPINPPIVVELKA